VVAYSWGAITLTTGASPGSSRVTYLQSARTACPASSHPTVRTKARTRAREVSRTARLNIPACSIDRRATKNLSHGRHHNRVYLWETAARRVDFRPGSAWWEGLTACDAVAIINVGGGNSSTGRAPDCGSDGCGFDSRFPPQNYSFRQRLVARQRPRSSTG
jgi:hypothetical protein